MEDEEPIWENPRGEMPLSEPGVMLRLFTPEDHTIVCAWWEAHGWPAIPLHRLPHGVIASKDGMDVAAGWLFIDAFGSGLALVEWLVSNPKAPARAVVAGMKTAVKFLVWRAGEDDFRCDYILTVCRQKGLQRLLEDSGYAVTDQNINLLAA